MVAIFNDTIIDAFTIDDESWRSLRQSYREQELRMTCGEIAIPKISSRGLRFFAHHPGKDCQLHESGPESAEHHAAKRALADAASAAGWTARIEYVAPDRAWIADVLVERDSSRIALEVQWSPQSIEEFERRTRRYARSGIECVWFLGPTNHSRDVARSYQLHGSADGLAISVPDTLGLEDTTVAIAEGLARLFSGELVSGCELRTNELYTTYFMLRCFVSSCNSWYSRWFITGLSAESRCRQKIAIELLGTGHGSLLTKTGFHLASAGHAGDTERGPIWGSFAQVRPEEELQRALVPLFEKIDMPPPCRYSRRRSKEVPEGYVAALCPKCGVMQGDGHLDGNEPREHIASVPWRTRVALSSHHAGGRHWCVDTGQGHCVVLPETRTGFPLDHQTVAIRVSPPERSQTVSDSEAPRSELAAD